MLIWNFDKKAKTKIISKNYIYNLHDPVVDIDDDVDVDNSDVDSDDDVVDDDDGDDVGIIIDDDVDVKEIKEVDALFNKKFF